MTSNVCLIVIDGWGVPTRKKGDAIHAAATPVMDALTATGTSIAAHGLDVGLPDGLMGNSEVGHLNIGAGRVVYQDIVRIDLAVKNHELHKQPAMAASFKRAKETNGRLHLIGLVSDGGVHSHQNHLYEIVQQAHAFGIPNIYIHFFADGRDTSPKSAVGYLKKLQEELKARAPGTASIATMTGRYYAMDRDKRWERIQLAYDALVEGKGEDCVGKDLVAAVEARYAAGETDEFLKPLIADRSGMLQDSDTILCFNYRSDRMREISQALGIAPLPFEGSKALSDLSISTMTRYKTDFPFELVFPAQTMDNVLAEWLDKKGIKQCHVAETEKIAHVTFFFNGGTEQRYSLEERDLIDSPKVATYDLQPEMSAIPVAECVARRVRAKEHGFVICNFAPPDMVGHTGIYEKAISAVEATDKAIGIIEEACKDVGFTLCVTADHGNAEQMLAEDGVTPHTAHTCAKVPLTLSGYEGRLKDGGRLCDVAPTLLQVMGIEKPAEMDGVSLISP